MEDGASMGNLFLEDCVYPFVSFAWLRENAYLMLISWHRKSNVLKFGLGNWKVFWFIVQSIQLMVKLDDIINKKLNILYKFL